MRRKYLPESVINEIKFEISYTLILCTDENVKQASQSSINKINNTDLKNPNEKISNKEIPVIVEADNLLDFLQLLQRKYNFDMMCNLTAVDYKDHFEVVYDLVSREKRWELMVKVILDRQKPRIPSVTELYPEADFQEREQYDLMGIKFLHHHNLRRILLPDDFIGHPLRKDFVMNNKQ